MSAQASASGRTLFGHPPGLTVLFLTQMWAEFSYYGLQALLVYYMTGHLGFSQAHSSLVFGAYGAFAFLSPLAGGAIADRWLGRTKSVVIGGAMMMAGHFAMAFEPLLYPALALVALGNGLFIPPLAVHVGSLYTVDDPRQAQAFSAYYMGINLGGFLAPLVCGTLGEEFGWHWGFGVAGVGMGIGLIVYLANLRLLPADPATGTARSGAAPIAFAVPERRNLQLLVAMIAAVVLFRIAYEQSGNVIALWVAHQTDRHVHMAGWSGDIPATWFQAINSLLIITLTPFLIHVWRVRDARRSDGGMPSHLFARMSLGCTIAGLAMVVMIGAARVNAITGRPVGAAWVIGYFVLLTLGELLTIPVGLSLIGKLSPPRIAAMLMGAWYIAKFAGSLLAGVMGAFWGTIPATAFFAIGALAVFAGAIVLRAMAFAESRRQAA